MKPEEIPPMQRKPPGLVKQIMRLHKINPAAAKALRNEANRRVAAEKLKPE